MPLVPAANSPLMARHRTHESGCNTWGYPCDTKLLQPLFVTTGHGDRESESGDNWGQSSPAREPVSAGHGLSGDTGDTFYRSPRPSPARPVEALPLVDAPGTAR